ncbi:MAG: DUF4834 family protein [Sediminibacterium sp.]|nr:DUF4834 family protein [Sediminibacterium sp.]
MRDLIFTIIAIWFIYKVYNAFFNQPRKTSAYNNPQSGSGSGYTSTSNSTPHKTSKKEHLSKKLADNEGEYVPFEEVKD